MAPWSLPPGFRFHPTDEELVAYYLHRKITGTTIELEIVPEVDLYKCEPWDLPDKSFLPSKDSEWYFYSPRDKKYPNGSRTNRATRAGYWKATGKDRAVHSQKRPVGMKKTLVYYRGRAPHGIRTNWVMHEYRLTDSFCSSAASSLKDSYALCRVFKKNMQIPKPKEGKKGNVDKDEMWMSADEQFQGDETSRRREAEYENFNNDFSSKLPSDTSSSDVTQGTPIGITLIEDSRAPFTSDEANSSAIMQSVGVNFPSNTLEVMEMPSYSSLHNYQVSYPPLVLEDFPQINLSEAKPGKCEFLFEYEMYNKNKDCMNGTLEEIFCLCSSQDNSTPLSM